MTKSYKTLNQKHPIIDREFQELQRKQFELFAKKMLDYGKDNISMGTALETDEEKKMALTATWTRMWDKMNRLKNLVVKRNDAQVDERIEDTYMDLANYALISLLVLNDDWK